MACKIIVITERQTSRASIGYPPLWELESTKFIDHNNSSDRKWLVTHCFWAMRNGRKVTMLPESN